MSCFLLLPIIAFSLSISPERMEQVAKCIFQNECGGTIEGLTSWNEGEEFASLGIGHFIWYPLKEKGPFQEQFPALLAFAEKQGAKIPKWLKEAKVCPWKSREDFQRDLLTPKMKELRSFLLSTLSIQAQYLAQRFENILPKMTAGLSQRESAHVTKMFDRISQEPDGIYILLDYLNFKGDGTSVKEHYNGFGWGLLQVLQEMSESSDSPTQEFVRSAKKVLIRRVKNAPPERKEERWMKGWCNRLDTYLTDTKLTKMS